MRVSILLFLFLFSALVLKAQDTEIFQLLENGNIQDIEIKIKELEQKKNNISKAYYGALTSKKASLYKTPKQKLSTFKKGVKDLEEAIKKDSSNNEIRFLRYIIQVKSPSFLNYNKNIKEDQLFIENSKINKSLYQLIIDFNKASNKYKINL